MIRCRRAGGSRVGQRLLGGVLRLGRCREEAIEGLLQAPRDGLCEPSPDQVEKGVVEAGASGSSSSLNFRGEIQGNPQGELDARALGRATSSPLHEGPPLPWGPRQG